MTRRADVTRRDARARRVGVTLSDALIRVADVGSRLQAGVIVAGALIAVDGGMARAQTPPSVPAPTPTETQAPAAPSSVEMEALAQYVGTWRAHDRTGADGRTSHFVYALSWFDAAHSMIEMVIEERFDDGEARLLWRGFKGWDPAEGRVYYHGFSPGGRAARGEVRLEGPDLVTEYDGWGPTGPVVRVRDVFTPIEDDAFTGRTLVRATPDGDWREVSGDLWTRVYGPSPPTR